MFSARSAFDRRRNRLELARARALREGRTLLDLTESNPTQAGFAADPRILHALARPGGAFYRPDPLGLQEARAAIAALMAAQGTAVSAERIVITASTSEAYAFLFKLLCDPGDDVLVPAPSYPLFEHLCRLEAVRARPYRLAYDGRWHLPASAIAAARGPRTRALLAVHPNNPTGSYLKREELAQLHAQDLPLVSDEVFAPYPLVADDTRVRSAQQDAATLTFTLHGLSKLAGLPQLKLAWICLGGPRAEVDEARARLELIADSFLSVSTPVQLALPEILAAQPTSADAIRARLRRNLDSLHAALAQSAASVLHVEGGWYAVLRLPSLLDDEGWALSLLEHHALLVQPGYFYEFEGGPYLVISLLTAEQDFAQGIARVRACVDAAVSQPVS